MDLRFEGFGAGEVGVASEGSFGFGGGEGGGKAQGAGEAFLCWLLVVGIACRCSRPDTSRSVFEKRWILIFVGWGCSGRSALVATIRRVLELVHEAGEHGVAAAGRVQGVGVRRRDAKTLEDAAPGEKRVFSVGDDAARCVTERKAALNRNFVWRTAQGLGGFVAVDAQEIRTRTPGVGECGAVTIDRAEDAAFAAARDDFRNQIFRQSRCEAAADSKPARLG